MMIGFPRPIEDDEDMKARAWTRWAHEYGSRVSFPSYWANLCRNPDNEEKLVHLSPTFLHELQQSSPPSCNDDLTVIEYSHPEKFWITKEIVFPHSKIAKLKVEVEMQDRQDGVNQSYTRNELVTALLYRCAVGAATASNSGAYTKSVLMRAVNMRPLIDPPFPKTSVGNLIALNDVPTYTLNETRLSTLIAQMKKGKFQLRGSKSLVGKNLALMLKYANTDQKPYFVSRICNFPLYDEMDFGWGKPVKASVVDIGVSNTAVMMDTPSGDGINTPVALEEQDMKNFLADKDLLAYASF
nr:PREDICTED: acylsugar acyltransferase 3-like [Daucus carota subsp. sativus]